MVRAAVAVAVTGAAVAVVVRAEVAVAVAVAGRAAVAVAVAVAGRAVAVVGLAAETTRPAGADIEQRARVQRRASSYRTVPYIYDRGIYYVLFYLHRSKYTGNYTGAPTVPYTRVPYRYQVPGTRRDRSQTP